jgi:sarcosine oxidase gamma subunit
MTAAETTPPLSLPQRRATLEAFARALDREAHNLQRWPHLTWQQLYNRLQWEDDSVPQVLAPELARRTAEGAAPWLHVRTPFGESRALIRTLAGHTGSVHGCAVSPDGCFIVSASGDHTLKIWDARAGAEQATLRARGRGELGRAPVYAVSPDGSFIVSAASVVDKTLKLWDARTGGERATLEGHTHDIKDCAISPDGAWIVSASWDDTLKIWDAATGKERAALAGHTLGVLACAISPDGSFVVSGSGDDTLKIWDARTGAERATLVGHSGSVVACAISPDGSFIVSAGNDDTLKIWDAETGTKRATLDGHAESVASCAISPDGSFVVSASWDNTIKVWEVATRKEEATVPLPGNPVCLALHSWQPLAACGDTAGSVYLIDLVGIEYGPIIVTAVDFGDGPKVRCRFCLEHLPLDPGWLGQVIKCPRPGCDGRLRVNPFIAGPPQKPRAPWWQFWQR